MVYTVFSERLSRLSVSMLGVSVLRCFNVACFNAESFNAAVLQYMVSYQTIVAVTTSITFFVDGSSLSSLQVTTSSCIGNCDATSCA